MVIITTKRKTNDNPEGKGRCRCGLTSTVQTGLEHQAWRRKVNELELITRKPTRPVRPATEQTPVPCGGRALLCC